MPKTTKTKGFNSLKDPERYLPAGPRGVTHHTAHTGQASQTTNQGIISGQGA
jgi:hypothetical protein